MIKTVIIDNFEGVYNLISQQKNEVEISRYRSSFLYRGLSNSNYKLETSLYRNCGKKQDTLEKCILRNFAKYAASTEPTVMDSVWRQMIFGQHHGLPTRLLDWTYSPLIAMHFACESSDLSKFENNDSVIWRIDIDELNSLLPEKYISSLTENSAFLFTIDMLEKITVDLNTYDSDMSNKSMALVEPPSIDQRIINQYSYFSVVPMGITNIEDFLNENTNNTCRYVITKDIKWRMRDMLDQMNINERIIYPGLDGLSTWLKRHYYVKREKDI